MTTDKDKTQHLANLVVNLLAERERLSKLAGLQYGTTRNIDAVLGYNTAPTIEDYKAMYDRRGLAATIIDAPAKTTWRKRPTITDGSDGKSNFSQQWEELRKRLSVFHYLERADRLSGLGRFGVILIGTKSGALSEPLESVSGPGDVIFLSPYSEAYAKVESYVSATNDPRFGRPEVYSIDLGGDLIQAKSAKGLASERVHSSRVIHIAEGLLENEVFGEPRLQKIYNLLQDLDKCVGPSAEGFWQSAVKGYTIGNKEGYEFDAEQVEAAKDELQNFTHGLQRFLAMEGIDLGELKGEIMDPTAIFNVLIAMISGKTGIPKRILLGSERGELASSQDEANWLGRIAERQEQFAEPRILRALIDRFVEIGAMEAPQDGEYAVEWPTLFYLTDQEQADVWLKRAQAISAVSGKFPQDIFKDEELRVAVGFPAIPEGEEPLSANALDLDESNEEVRAEFEEIHGLELRELITSKEAAHGA